MQHDNFLDNRKDPPLADKLAARIIHETAYLPQQKSWIEQLKDMLSARPAQVAFAALCLVLLSVAVLSTDQVSSPTNTVQFAEVQGPSGYEEFATVFEQETLTFMVADLN